MKRDLYTSFFTVYGLVMTFDGLVMQGILSLENKSAIVKSTRKLSKKSPASEKVTRQIFFRRYGL
jgi:hypothetical protein